MKLKKNILISLAAVLVVLGGGYVYKSLAYQDHFLPNTQVLGVNISGKTPAAANTALKNHFQKQHYAFTDGTKTVATASGEQLGLDQNYSALLKKVKSSQNPWRWTESVIAASKTDALKTPNVNQSALDTYISQTVAKLNATRKAPVNASVQSDANGNFIIQKEVAGNQIDAKKLKAQTLTAISQDKDTVDLTATYQDPAIKSDDSKLKAAVSKLNAISQISGKIQIETHTITIPTATIKSWLSYTNGQVEVSKTGVANYVAALNTKYSTFGLTRKFKSTKLGTVSVPGGTYGWGIDQPKEVESIIAAVKTGKDFTKEVVYTGSGYHKDGTDIGNTYVEVDKTNQHEYVYKDGKLILDSAIVSGKPGQDTPTGVFAVWDKQRNATLRGKNNDGSNYASPVSYWMPIDYTGVGLHDSPWQPTYGGDWYQAHGSHGCVNNPPDFMAKLFAAVEVGTPVIVIG